MYFEKLTKFTNEYLNIISKIIIKLKIHFHIVQYIYIYGDRVFTMYLPCILLYNQVHIKSLKI
jgi:hypothetical protein